MDDITVVGTSASLIAFSPILKDELEQISLIMNTRKTTTTSPALANFLNCAYDECPKLLGAYVSRSRALEKSNIDKLPAKHAPLFNRLPVMPAEIGFRLLTLCGVPRWAHLIRTHEPDVTHEASVDFTGMAVRCACSILRVDYNEMNAQVYRQLRLPVRFGGMGVIDWAEAAEEAYAASLNGESMRAEFDPNAPDDAEQVTRDMRWEALMEGIKSADAEFHGHLLRCSTKMSRLWLAGDITVESSQPPLRP